MVGGALAAALGTLGTFGAGAQATTGPGIIFRAPLYKVDKATQRRYEGTYGLVHRDSSSRLEDSTMVIRMDSMGFLDGVIQAYQYGSHGRRSLWVATVYDFHYLGAGHMKVSILDDDGDRQGALDLHRSEDGVLSGTLAMDGEHFDVAFRKGRSSSGPSARESQPLRVGRRNERSRSGGGNSGRGWARSPMDYVGGYRVAASRVTGSAAGRPDTGGALLLGLKPLAQAALSELGVSSASAPANPVERGHLNIIFVHGGGKGLGTPTGVLQVTGSGGPTTYHLTSLSHAGARRTAVVRVGGERGKVVGAFRGRRTSRGTIKGTLRVRGYPRVAVTFKRTSGG